MVDKVFFKYVYKALYLESVGKNLYSHFTFDREIFLFYQL